MSQTLGRGLYLLAMAAMTTVGCSETTSFVVGGGGTSGNDGTGHAGGTAGGAGTGHAGGTPGAGGSGGVAGSFACSEQGIRDAIAEGGGPHLFACDGPTTVVTTEQVLIDNDVILDGRSNLTVDGGMSHRVFLVPEGVTAELRGFTVTGGATEEGENGGGIWNGGVLGVVNSTVVGNTAAGVGGGIHTDGTLTVTRSTVSDNAAANGGGIHVGSETGVGDAVLINSTVSHNAARNGIGGGIRVWSGMVILTSTTVSRNTGTNGSGLSLQPADSLAVVTNSLLDGQCFDLQLGVISNGHNIESPGETCGFNQDSDQAGVSVEQLSLGPLQNNGGPTTTHALRQGSAAIDWIDEALCEVSEDQRGVLRPWGAACDVGAFELDGE